MDAANQLQPQTIDNALAVLEDEKQRQELIDFLKSLQVAEEAEPQAEPLGFIRQEIEKRTQAVEEVITTLTALPKDAPIAARWFLNEIENERRRDFWLRTISGIASVLALGGVAAWLAARVLAGLRRPLQDRETENVVERTPVLLARMLLAAVPVGVFYATVYAVDQAFEFGNLVEAAAAQLVYGITFVYLTNAAAGILLTWKNPSQQLFPVGPVVGRSLQRRITRIVAIGGYGYFILEAALKLGLPWTTHGFLLHLLFLVTFGQFVALVLAHREAAASALRRMGSQQTGGLFEGFLPWSFLSRYWHILAILFGLAMYVTWSLQIPGGTLYLFRATVLSLVVLAMMKGLNLFLTERSKSREKRPDRHADEDDVSEIIAGAAGSPLTFFLRLAITALGVALILELWGANVFSWLASDAGLDARQRMIAAGTTLGIAYLLWFAAGGALRGVIEETDAAGQRLRSQRSQTLLAIVRNLLFLIVWVTAVMVTLGELGINLAPLLAGAGVIGLAIGFGSQRLVQDMLTGFFILIEDTIAVGEVAEVAGKTGTVESISLRTIRLRGYDGQLHTIPFSGIDVISNFTKDYSYYVFDVGVAYGEDVDTVMEVLRAIGRGMQHDRSYRRLILAPLEVAGLDQFADSAVVIKARIKTRPMQQWAVGREFNRRIKKRFDELGIEIPYPHQTLYFGEAKSDKPAPSKGKDAPLVEPAGAAAGGAYRERLAAAARIREGQFPMDQDGGDGGDGGGKG